MKNKDFGRVFPMHMGVNRLLEANQRGLWTEVESATLERLRLMVNEAEGVIESQGNS